MHVCLQWDISFEVSWEKLKKKQLIHRELNIYLICPLTLYDLWKFISTIFIFIRHTLDIFLCVSRII